MKHLKTFCLILVLSFGLLLSCGRNMIYADEAASTPLSIVSIDAGRKYFSEAQLIEIIEGAYQNGYTGVQVLLGNDGLRFVLDDMTMTVEGTRYESDDVKNAITEGNKHYYDDPNGNVLTESAMNRILTYAQKRNIDIIPVINSPGHMDAILVAMEHLGLSDVRYQNNGKISERTVNIENKQAIAFVQELTKKYAQYFGNYGASSMFNFGADEYANDVFTTPGWGELQNKGLYGDFIKYANTLAQIIKDAGMKPMSFNDGIYYNHKDDFGTFDKDIVISYWTSGWWGFNVAKPDYFANKGHDLLNTNDAWYWVLGHIDKDAYNYHNALKNIKNNPFDQLAGGSFIPSIGSMQAIWADDPQQDHGMDKILNLMDTFSKTPPNILIKPANYEALEQTLQAIPSDLGIYNDESVKRLEKAKSNIQRGLRIVDQDQVDTMTQELQTSIKLLTYKKADYSKLNSLKAKIELLDTNAYQNFDDIEKILGLIHEDLNITQQAKLDHSVNELEQAIEALLLKDIAPSPRILSSLEPTAKSESSTLPKTKTVDRTSPTLVQSPSTPALGQEVNKKFKAEVLPQTGVAHSWSTLSISYLLTFGGMLLLKKVK